MRFAVRFLPILVLIFGAGYVGAEPDFSTAPAVNLEVQESQADIEVFVREGCPHCAHAKQFMAQLQHERPELHIVMHDVLSDPAAMKSLQRLAAAHGMTTVRVPTIRVGDQLIVGFSEEAGTARFIRQQLQRTSYGSEGYAVELFGLRVSLAEFGLPMFTLAIGLLDGFNPCSMWVLLLMISLLAPLNDRKRMLVIAGTFVAVQGIIYFVFVAAWLNLFLLIGLSRASEVAIAVLALLAGTIHLKDFWRFGWGVTLSIPAAAKPDIYARMRQILQAQNLFAALFGTIALALLVQIVEFMCTSGLPALYARILTQQQLDAVGYYAYLLLYNMAYMLDDIVILAIGIVTLSQRRLQEKEGRWLKLLSGLVMVGLGVYLLIASH